MPRSQRRQRVLISVSPRILGDLIARALAAYGIDPVVVEEGALAAVSPSQPVDVWVLTGAPPPGIEASPVVTPATRDRIVDVVALVLEALAATPRPRAN